MLGARTDTASRFIKASSHTIYQALSDPKAWSSWLPPTGMEGRIDYFDFRVGGTYRMQLTYMAPEHTAPGKTSEHSDVVRGRFVEVVRERRIVQLVEFESEEAAFEGTMKMTWELFPAPEGTEVTIVCENVPPGIRKEDHDEGLRSTLANLAAFTE